jgi:two-component system, OmpR family, sensor kinase
MKIRWFYPLAPAILGIGLSLYVSLAAAHNPVLYLRADTATLILLAGLALSGFGYFLLAMLIRLERQRKTLAVQSADDRQRFLRRLDHELKNPLTAIRAGLANVAEAADEHARQEAAGSVEAQALRLSRLAADLRKLAELETREIERAPVNVTQLLEEAFSIAQDHAGEARRLSLSIPQAPWPLPEISGDQDLLLLAIHNLLDNAIKFTRLNDRVEVRAFEDGSTIVIEVADTGPGIPDDELPYVWEELYRGKGARGIPGSGLGLALVRGIAERHRGQVTLRSRKGQGTVVILRLPAG